MKSYHLLFYYFKFIILIFNCSPSNPYNTKNIKYKSNIDIPYYTSKIKNNKLFKLFLFTSSFKTINSLSDKNMFLVYSEIECPDEREFNNDSYFIYNPVCLKLNTTNIEYKNITSKLNSQELLIKQLQHNITNLEFVVNSLNSKIDSFISKIDILENLNNSQNNCFKNSQSLRDNNFFIITIVLVGLILFLILYEGIKYLYKTRCYKKFEKRGYLIKKNNDLVEIEMELMNQENQASLMLTNIYEEEEKTN
ncbi:MAG: hypothetical protein GY830_05345 [Bacteroidetes bacterium]|nr:hypothetical protein [Bacteroidota bacterium]